jgi:osmotically-inducible protein OsmY
MQHQGAATDTDLEGRVKQALQQDAKLGAQDISVNAKGNVVYLTGTVDTRADRSHAVALASRVEGVTKVEDKMIIGGNQ